LRLNFKALVKNMIKLIDTIKPYFTKKDSVKAKNLKKQNIKLSLI